ERYLSAADRISSLAFGDPDVEPGSDTYRAKQDLSQDQHIEGLPFGTVGGIFLRPIGGAEDLAKMRNPTDGSDAIDSRFRIRVPMKAGRHKVVATFVQ